jgi:hypothetical protein
MHRPCAITFELILLIAALAGCNLTAPVTADQKQQANLQALAVLYGSATTALSRPPKSEDEFKKYIGSQRGKMLDVLRITDPDALFVSQRDGKPFVVIYGQRQGERAPGAVAYEQDGVGGRRLVALESGIVVELDEPEFRQQVASIHP